MFVFPHIKITEAHLSINRIFRIVLSMDEEDKIYVAVYFARETPSKRPIPNIIPAVAKPKITWRILEENTLRPIKSVIPARSKNRAKLLSQFFAEVRDSSPARIYCAKIGHGFLRYLQVGDRL